MRLRGRRHELRNQCADLLKIRWMDETGELHREIATLEDISAGGVCLKVENPIPRDTILKILYPGGQYQGRIKHCDAHMDWFFIGVEFLPGYRWSKEHFTPAHLLEFRFRNRQSKQNPPDRLTIDD